MDSAKDASRCVTQAAKSVRVDVPAAPASVRPHFGNESGLAPALAVDLISENTEPQNMEFKVLCMTDRAVEVRR